MTPEDLLVDLAGLSLAVRRYEVPGGRPVLFLCGGADNLEVWDPPFLQAVLEGDPPISPVLFDYRDHGRSTKFEMPGCDPEDLVQRLSRGEDVQVELPYTLLDVANDVVRLADRLGLQELHLFGISFGAMLAQQVATLAPDRVSSVTALCATPLVSDRPPFSPEVSELINRPVPRQLDRYLDYRFANNRVFRCQELRDLPALYESRFRRIFARAHDALGKMQQLLAIIKSPALGLTLDLTCPTTLILGAQDVVFAHDPSRRIFEERLPHARILTIEDLNHEIHLDHIGPIQQALAQTVSGAARR